MLGHLQRFGHLAVRIRCEYAGRQQQSAPPCLVQEKSKTRREGGDTFTITSVMKLMEMFDISSLTGGTVVMQPRPNLIVSVGSPLVKLLAFVDVIRIRERSDVEREDWTAVVRRLKQVNRHDNAADFTLNVESRQSITTKSQGKYLKKKL
jgi:hypothetical protein